MEFKKKRYGIMSCNIYCNFTNYGSALQTYALQKVINGLDSDNLEAIVMDYCPDVLRDVDILNPFKNMWDQDEESQKNCNLSLDSIRINKEKFDKFYNKWYNISLNSYTGKNLNESLERESLNGYVVGSDTVFCIEEFKLDSGYFANYPCMRGKSVSYAASFGDSRFTDETYRKLNTLLHNFKALGIREEGMITYLKEQVKYPVSQTIDPTLLLSSKDYDELIGERQYDFPYLLLYSRRYNKHMEDYARRIAEENGWKVVEISLRATNSEKGSIMRYDAGVEEFLSLIKYSEMVVTNSFHGMIFAVQFCKPFIAFSRNECDKKIDDLLKLFDLSDRLVFTGDEEISGPIDFAKVHERIAKAREESLEFLRKELTEYIDN